MCHVGTLIECFHSIYRFIFSSRQMSKYGTHKNPMISHCFSFLFDHHISPSSLGLIPILRQPQMVFLKQVCLSKLLRQLQHRRIFQQLPICVYIYIYANRIIYIYIDTNIYIYIYPNIVVFGMFTRDRQGSNPHPRCVCACACAPYKSNCSHIYIYIYICIYACIMYIYIYIL